MVLHGLDATTNAVSAIKVSSNKIQIRASELESKLDTLNTTMGNVNVSVGDVTVNTADLEALQTTANSSLSSIDAKHTTANSSLSSVDSSLSSIDTNIADIDSSMNTLLGYVDGLETLQTSTNTKLDSVISNTAGSSITRNEVSVVSSSSVSASSDIGSSVDNTGYKSVRILGESSSQDGISLYGSTDNTNWYYMEGVYTNYPSGSSQYYFNQFVENAPKYIKVRNDGGTSQTLTIYVERQTF